MGGISLYRVHEVRDEVVAALELHVDVRPGLLGAVDERHEVIIDKDEDDEDDRDDDKKDVHIVCWMGLDGLGR